MVKVQNYSRGKDGRFYSQKNKILDIVSQWG